MGGRQPAGPSGTVYRPGDLRIGRISGVFGVRGEVRLHLYNRDSDLFRKPIDVDLVAADGSRRTVRLTSRPGAGKRVLGRVDGVQGRERAEALIGLEIVVEASRLPEPDPNQYYHHQIIGLAVQTVSGESLGHLAEIYPTGDHDIWVVRGDGCEAYVPALSQVVLDVDLDGGIIVVADDVLSVL